MKHAAHCNHCRHQLVLDAADDCPTLRIEHWLKIVVCHRCGDYAEKRRSLLESIQAICNAVGLATEHMREAARDKARQSLNGLTQRFVVMLCKRWQTTNDWGDEMVSLLLAEPLRATMALRAHEKQHRLARERADAEVRERLRKGE